MSNNSIQEVKCVIVGDGNVGKTSMLMAYTEGRFPEDYVPTVFENYEALMLILGKEIKLSLWDTAGQEGYKRIRVLSYPRTDIFLVCFSIVEPGSFVNLKQRWIPEITYHCPNAPYIFVGLKSDLRDNKEYLEKLHEDGFEAITFEEAVKEASALGALKYLECSAKTNTGLKKVFDQAMHTVVTPKTEKKKKKPCAIL